MNLKSLSASFALAVLLLPSCNKAQPAPKPELRDVTVSVDVQSNYDFLSTGKVTYTCDGKSAEAKLDAGKFTASVTPEASDISVNVGPAEVTASQNKYYLKSDEEIRAGMRAAGDGTVGDNDAKVTLQPLTSAIKIKLYDSKFYAIDEQIKSVTFTSEKAILGESKSVAVTWKGAEPDVFPKVAKLADAAEYGMVLDAAGTVSGKFTVVTDRYTYEFTKADIKLSLGLVTIVSLDFSTPDVQPKRKVGVLGDSISTFAGYMDPSYSAFYPGSDATPNGTGTVQSVQKTYWWKVINEKMKYGVLDKNRTNSWSGTKVVSEGGVKGFVDRAYAFEDPDIIMIHGGTNDMNQTTPMGNFDFDLPMSQLNDKCFRSAYVKLIKMLQTRYPGVQIIIIVGDRLAYYEYNNSKPELNYATSAIEIAKHFGLPYVDFTNNGKSYNSLPKSTGSHPNATGMQQMADKIYSTCIDYLP